MPTVCATCAHLHITNKNDPWWRWLCMRSEMPIVFNPVTGLTVADPPRKFCAKLNFGDCPEWESGPNSLQSREDIEANDRP